MGVGVFKDYEVAKSFIQLGVRAVPDPEKHARYMKFYTIFRDLYPALKDLYVRLGEAR